MAVTKHCALNVFAVFGIEHATFRDGNCPRMMTPRRAMPSKTSNSWFVLFITGP
jgi:hypothetical protein